MLENLRYIFCIPRQALTFHLLNSTDNRQAPAPRSPHSQTNEKHIAPLQQNQSKAIAHSSKHPLRLRQAIAPIRQP